MFSGSIAVRDPGHCHIRQLLKPRLNLDSSEKAILDQLSWVFHCVTLVYHRIMYAVLTNKVFRLTTLQYRQPLWIIFLAIDCETTLPIRSIHTRVTVPKDRNRCSCTTRFSTLSSRGVVFFGRPDIALLAKLPGCLNLRNDSSPDGHMYGDSVGWTLLQHAACWATSGSTLPSSLFHAPS